MEERNFNNNNESDLDGVFDSGLNSGKDGERYISQANNIPKENTGFWGWIREMGAKYQSYLNKANHKAYLARKQAEMNNFGIMNYENYHTLLVTAVENTYRITKIVPSRSERGLRTNQCPIVQLPNNNGYGCRFKGYKNPEYPNVAMKDILITLNDELCELSAYYGYFPALRVTARLRADGSNIVDFIVFQPKSQPKN